MMAAYPHVKFQFKIVIDGLEVGDFSEVVGLDASAGVMEYEEGDRDQASMKVAGLKYDMITLKRGMVNSRVFYDWMIAGMNGNVEKKTITITFLDTIKMASISWCVINAWPVKCIGPDFNATSSEVVVESLEIAHEGIDCEYFG